MNGDVIFVGEDLVSEASLPFSMKKSVCKVSVTAVMEMCEIPLCDSSTLEWPQHSALQETTY